MPRRWCKLHAELARDPKILTLPMAMRWRFIQLMCFHCDNDDITALSEEELRRSFACPLRVLRETKQTFISKGLIDDSWGLLHWDKRQNDVSPSAERTRRYRERLNQSVTVTPRDENQKRHRDVRREENRRETSASAVFPTVVDSPPCENPAAAAAAKTNPPEKAEEPDEWSQLESAIGDHAIDAAARLEIAGILLAKAISLAEFVRYELAFPQRRDADRPVGLLISCAKQLQPSDVARFNRQLNGHNPATISTQKDTLSPTERAHLNRLRQEMEVH